MTAKQFRVVVGIILVGVIFGLFALDYYLESRVAGCLVAGLMGLGGYVEFARMVRSKAQASGIASENRLLSFVGLLATVYFLGLAWWQGANGALPSEWASGGVVALVFLAFVCVLFRDDFLGGFHSLPATVLGALLYGLLYSYLLRIYHQPDGTLIGIVFCLGVKGTDISAYLVGSTIGKTRYLKVSPGKTVAGSVAALVFGAVWFGGACALHPETFFEWPLGIVFGIILAVTSPLGDLAESLLKRYYGVKDSGALLPEFGGFLDLIDSFVFSSFLFWCLLIWA